MNTAVINSIGQTLRTRRIQQGWSLEEVAKSTRIHSRYIKALEDEAWDVLPARVYLEGFLLNYANHLGLDGSALVSHYRASLGDAAKHEGDAEASPSREEPPEELSSFHWRVGLLLAALLVLAVVLFYRRGAEEPTRATLLEQLEPVAPDAPPVAPLSHTLQLFVTDRAWLRLWIDGHVKFEGTLPAGSSRNWLVESSLKIQSGNFPGLNVSVDGQSLALPTARVSTEVVWTPASTVPAPPSARDATAPR